jgi:hypothetical protein
VGSGDVSTDSSRSGSKSFGDKLSQWPPSTEGYVGIAVLAVLLLGLSVGVGVAIRRRLQ